MDTNKKPKYSKEELIEKGRVLVENSAAGKYKRVLELLNDGISPDAAEYTKSLFYNFKNFATPLHMACLFGQLHVVDLLIKYGADVNYPDRYNLTPLHVVADNGDLAILQILIEAEADCNVATRSVPSGYTSIIPYESNTTALHMATMKNHIDCVVELIQSGADYNALDKDGHTSLALATNLGFSECVIAHIRNDVKKDMLSLPCTLKGNTPLHSAVINGMYDCVTELLAIGADPNHYNEEKRTPFHCLLHRLIKDPHKNHELVKQMILKGYNINLDLIDDCKYSPLHYISYSFRYTAHVPPTLSLLISYGADPDIKGPFGSSLLELEFTKRKWDSNVVAVIMQASKQLPKVESFRNHRYFSRFSHRYLHDFEERAKWYRSMQNSLKTLQHLCRLQVRSRLKTAGLCQISKLPIPKKLQEFILLR